MTEVVAALMRKGGRVLICRRPEGKDQAGKWEFPGGKLEPGETGAQALARECLEELDIQLDVGDALADVTYGGIHLSLYECAIRRGTPRALEHSDIRWADISELGAYELCPADALLLEHLELKL